MGLLEGRVAVVTGSSRGIGRAVAEELARQGCAVVVNGRDAVATDAAAAAITGAGGRALAVSGSAARVADDLAAAAVDGLGGLDVLVNCAGTPEPPGSSILDISDDDWQMLLDAHLTSTFATCRAAAPHFVAQRSGAIVNTSSHAFTGVYGGTGYAAGKGAVNSLTMAVAAELREHGVRANVVCPGARTRLSSGDEYERHVRTLHARGLLDEPALHGSLDPAPPEYVAPLYAFLASDLAAGITGEVFVGAGCYLGRFPKPEAQHLAWRDHHDQPPWTPEEVAAVLSPA